MSAFRLTRGVREAALAAAAAFAVLLSALVPGGERAWRLAETASLDLRYRIRGPLPVRPDIALVIADDASIARLGRFPFSRHLVARAVERIDAAGAKVILFDQLFLEPERPNPPDLREVARAAAAALPREDATIALRARLAGIADDDADLDLAGAIRASGKVLLPFAFVHPGTAAPPAEDVDLSDSAYQAFDKSQVTPEDALRPVGVQAPIAPLREAAAGLGHVAIAFDVDGEPRYDYAAVAYNGDFLPSVAIRAVAAALGVPWAEVALAPGEGVRIAALSVPTDRFGRMLIDYHGDAGAFRRFAFADLVEGRVPPHALAGRIVILGASFTGDADSQPQPFSATEMPGAERWANAISTILDGGFIRETQLARPVAAVLLLAAALAGAVMARLPTRLMALAGVLPILAWFGAAQWAFDRGWWVPVAMPLGALASAALAALLFRYWVTDRDRRLIKATFKRYMAPKLVDILSAHPDRVQLGGETRRMTLLFCDIRGFTTISEAYAHDPQGLTRLINRFLSPMTDIILASGGTIDKYMGDCIMAFWNAPLDDLRHADLACGAVLAMRAALGGLNRTLEEEAREAGRTFHEIRIGVGLNTGDCVVGNMGSEQRLDYSVLGDAVNLASRLEGQSKIYGVDIVIGETTRADAPGWAALELDRIAVRGKRAAVRIYALLGDAELARSEAFRDLERDHGAMLAAYRAQDWAAAREALDAAARHAPGLGTVYALYAERIARYAAHPPGPQWDGVYVAESK